MVKLSIITINYNNAEGLQKTMGSVITQTYRDFEYIVVDGGSTDNSCQVLKDTCQLVSDQTSFKGKAEVNGIVVRWISENDSGIYNAMNKGIGLASGEYCLFLNSGDCLAGDNVLQVVFDGSYDEDIVYGNAVKIKPHYRRLIRYSPVLTLYDFYRTVAAIHHQACFIKRELFQKYGMYREDLEINADWEFFFRVIILEKVKTKYTDKVICIADGTGLSNTLKKGHSLSLQASDAKEKILKTYFPEYILADYKKLDELLTRTSIMGRICRKMEYFRLRK